MKNQPPKSQSRSKIDPKISKVCSINFEPPDIDLCFQVPRLLAFLWSMDYFSTIYIQQTDLGVGFHNLMNSLKPLTFRVKTFQLLLFMKSQLNVNSQGPQ